jgi:tetratricopeptide (TPR) repeat protein
MTCPKGGRAATLALLASFTLTQAALAQYREYYVRGRVVDPQKKPIPGVEIVLLDAATSRRFEMKTDGKGEFKFAGLPHATYQVTFTADGYVAATDKWDFSRSQERMQKVDVPDVVLQSQTQAAELQRLGAAKAGVEEAAEKIRKGDLDGALSALQKVLADSPQDPNALYYLGLAYGGKKMYAEAVAPLTKVTELTPTFPSAWFELGVCYRGLGQTEKSLAAYDKSLELEPDNADANYNSGLILFETNRIEEALARFERGLDARPADPDLLEMAGRCYLHEAKFDQAVASLEKARAATTDPRKAEFLDELIKSAKTVVR